MASGFARAIVQIPMDTNNPVDTVTNTWYFDGESTFIGTVDEFVTSIADRLATFYQAIDNTVFPVQVANPVTVDVYDMAEAPPRTPIGTRTFNLTPSVDTGLPSEVAVCLSFRAAPASGTNPARRRGRVYIGPLALGSVTVDGGAPVRPTAAVRMAIRNAALALRNDDSLGIQWAIYSPTTDLTASLADSFHDVDSGYVDDAFDIQRRRGVETTARTVFP